MIQRPELTTSVGTKDTFEQYLSFLSNGSSPTEQESRGERVSTDQAIERYLELTGCSPVRPHSEDSVNENQAALERYLATTGCDQVQNPSLSEYSEDEAEETPAETQHDTGRNSATSGLPRLEIPADAHQSQQQDQTLSTGIPSEDEIERRLGVPRATEAGAAMLATVTRPPRVRMNRTAPPSAGSDAPSDDIIERMLDVHQGTESGLLGTVTRPPRVRMHRTAPPSASGDESSPLSPSAIELDPSLSLLLQARNADHTPSASDLRPSTAPGRPRPQMYDGLRSNPSGVNLRQNSELVSAGPQLKEFERRPTDTEESATARSEAGLRSRPRSIKSSRSCLPLRTVVDSLMRKDS